MLERIAQLVLGLGLRTTSPVTKRVFKIARSMLVRVGDPAVEYELTTGQRLRLPLSHEFPHYRRRFPNYAQNIVDIAEVLTAKYPATTCIDIGANVGDTALLLQQAGEIPVLCIEGDEPFLAYLRRNVRDFPHIEIASVFVAPPGVTGAVIAGRGTAHLDLEAGAKPLPTATLGQILAAHPRFHDANLMKIDTDGMDVQIILDNVDWLAAVRPVLFFEYDPYLGQLDPADVKTFWFTALEMGYREAAFYENTGDLLAVVGLDQQRVLEDLHYRYARTNGAMYADVCLLSLDDLDLIEALRLKSRAR